MRHLQMIPAFLKLGRLHFLFGGVVLHCLGVMIALYTDTSFDPATFLWAQIAITATQWMTHYANDYFDLEADQQNQTPTNWSGGSRVLVEDKLPEQVALITAIVLAAVAFIANIILSTVIRPGINTFLLLFLAQSLAWFYSAPPIRLHSLGLGEATTMIVVTILTPLTGFYLQTGSFALLPLLAVMPLSCLQFAMLLAIEFPDAVGDQVANKRTLVVRLGAQTAAHCYVTLIVLAYLMLPLLVYVGLPRLVAASVALLSPLGIWQIWHIRQGDWQMPFRWNSLALYTIVLLVGSSLAELAAFTLLVYLSS